MELSGTLLGEVAAILIRVAAAFACILVGRWLARRSRVWLGRALTRTKLTPSVNRLIITLTYLGVLISAILVALGVLGVELQVLLAGAGVFIIILGIALRESIADFASTITFLLLQPYKVGDVIETCSVTGTVKEIQIFQTVIEAFDRSVVILSNSNISTSGITNRTVNGIIRGQVDFGISFADDVSQAKHIIEETMAEDARILKDPAATVIVTSFASSGVILCARPFSAYFDSFFVASDLREHVKARLEAAGMTMAFPIVVNTN